MTNICATTPYSKKDSPYGEPAFCPVLLQETKHKLLLEDGEEILL